MNDAVALEASPGSTLESSQGTDSLKFSCSIYTKNHGDNINRVQTERKTFQVCSSFDRFTYAHTI